MHKVQIRPVKENELDDLQHISMVTFETTFKEHCSPSDLNLFLTNSYSKERLSEEYKQTGSHFFFAELSGSIIGYLKTNQGEAQTENMLEQAFEIERIYVLEAFHGKQIGQSLLDKAFELAKKGNYKTIWLGVWENNTRAIRFYEKNGFKTFSKHVFPVGNDPQIDLLMKLEL